MTLGMTRSLTESAEAVALPPDTWAPVEQNTPSANLLVGLMREMRCRWSLWVLVSTALAGGLGIAGYQMGTKTFASEAVLRVYPSETGILYASRDDSVLKTFTSFIKAETATVASHPVMSRAAHHLNEAYPVLTEGMQVLDLRGSIEIKRSESLIVLKTKSKDAAFAAAKLDAVTGAYLALSAETKLDAMHQRSAELLRREAELLAQLRELDRRRLEVGGEFGSGAIVKAHVEKVAQIDGLSTRRAEVERTLESMRRNEGGASADMNDEHILRATLLDRGLADLNIEIARHKAELATLRERYTPRARVVKDKQQQIDILEAAQADRREQIQVLGQTGALTDQTERGEEESLAAIEALLAKVTGELEAARKEARDLNARRVELAFLEEERDETRRMLDDTRSALDEIQIESRSETGLVELMSPAVVPVEPAEDSSKMQALLGAAAGWFFGTALIFGAALTRARVAWSDSLGKSAPEMQVMRVLGKGMASKGQSYAHAMDRLRTKIQLVPTAVGENEARKSARCLTVLRAGRGDARSVAQGLAKSFAHTDMKVLFIEADAQAAPTDEKGWRDLDLKNPVEPMQDEELYILPAGQRTAVEAQSSFSSLRKKLGLYDKKFDVIVIHGGAVTGSIDAELFASASDFTLAEVRRGDRKQVVAKALNAIFDRPRHGAAIVFSQAHNRDPGLAS